MSDQALTLDPRKRYHCIVLPGGEPGRKTLALVEGIPDPERPADPKKDSKTGPVIIEAVQDDFWPLVRRAGFSWIEPRAHCGRWWQYRPPKGS